MAVKKTRTNYSFGNKPEDISRTLDSFVRDVYDDLSQLNPNIVTSLPTAEKDKRGSFLILEAASTDDKLYFCILNSGGGYTWKQIQFV